MQPQDSVSRAAVALAQQLPEYQAIQQYFELSGRTPDLKSANLEHLGSDVNGLYVTPGFAGDDLGLGLTRPTIVLDTFKAASNPAKAPGTLVHEMVHATLSNMIGQIFDKKSPAGRQFKAAFSKLIEDYDAKVGTPGSAASVQTSSKIAPEWTARNRGYRTSQGDLEIPAHGLGNMLPGVPPTNPAPAHIDATAAQEFMILLDLAVRDMQQQKAKQK
jgi:hypothetical protein